MNDMSAPFDKPLRILISHVAEDDELARRAAATLRHAGYDVWTGDEIYPGDNWAAKYAEALACSQVMVPLLSPAALDSERVQSDLSFALGQKQYANRLIPVFLGGADPLSNQFPWVLRRLPLVRVSNESGGEERASRRWRPSSRGLPHRRVTERARSAWLCRGRSPMPADGRPAEVFLSHSSADRAFVVDLATAMRRHGVPVWYSGTEIVGAQQWHDEIGSALARCDWFVLILSPNAVESMWVKRELQFALRQNRFDGRIVPLLRRACDADALSWTLGAMQFVDCRRGLNAAGPDLLRVWGLGYRPE